LLNLVIRRRREPLECLRLDAVDFGFDLSDFRKCGRRQRCADLLGAYGISPRRSSDDGDRSEHHPS